MVQNVLLRMISIKEIIKGASYNTMRSEISMYKIDDNPFWNLGSKLKELKITKQAFRDQNASKALDTVISDEVVSHSLEYQRGLGTLKNLGAENKVTDAIINSAIGMNQT